MSSVLDKLTSGEIFFLCLFIPTVIGMTVVGVASALADRSKWKYKSLRSKEVTPIADSNGGDSAGKPAE